MDLKSPFRHAAVGSVLEHVCKVWPPKEVVVPVQLLVVVLAPVPVLINCSKTPVNKYFHIVNRGKPIVNVVNSSAKH